ncbi:geranylgeranyl reductase [hydrothermal vent metagenome]|uniref:Geranylgeranyl reductase n=1 Tax=hydrothermal vent metagenome TaxID=652676 RepID=A0A3B0T1R2_9ZZZZ
MNKQPDILVIGLGPAGACAAKAAALAGYSVLAIEKKTTAGTPVQCAEFVPAMIGAEVSALHHSTIQPINSMVTRVEQQPADRMPDFPGRMIDRAAFDLQLGQQAAQAGAKLRYGVRVREISKSGKITLSDASFVSPKIIIGADGPHSVIGRSIGSGIDEFLETRQINLTLQQPFTSTDIYLSQQMPGGYAWAFPKGDTVNLGLGVHPKSKHKLKPFLDDLHHQLIDEGRVGRQIHSHTGGAIPAGGMVRPFGKRGQTLCLLAGDAAGLTNPITGAGINSAVISGQMAGETAARYLAGQPGAPAEYMEDLDDLFGASIARALAHKARLANHPHPGPEQLRSGWIAYPEYWQLQPAAQLEETSCPV